MYDNPSCSGVVEFRSDLLKIKYIKRLINRYTRTQEISARLLLNHIISVYNVFYAPSVSTLLFFRSNKESWGALKTVLEYVNLMPEELFFDDGTVILNKNIPRDEVLWAKLVETVEDHATTR